MSVFKNIDASRPPGDIVVPPEAWASTWRDRPIEDVCIGLRFVAESELEDARVEAKKRADGLFPGDRRDDATFELWRASFMGAMMKWIIARGTCDPNNIAAAWEGWSAAPEDMAHEVLTDHGMQLIFDAWERMRIVADVGLVPASDEDLSLLPEMLLRLPRLAEKSRAQALRVRRLLRYALEELETVEG